MPAESKRICKQIVLGYDEKGKQIRKRVYAEGKRELQRKIDEIREEYKQVRRPSAVTFGAYSERWLSVYKSSRSVKTREMYRTVLNKCESLDGIPIKDVTKTDCQAIINEHREHPKTCRNISLTLKQIFKAAVADGIIAPYNPADALDLPKYVPREMRFITDAEMKIIKKVDLAPLDRLYVEVLRCTGMRPAEALALQWGDIEPEKIRINRSFEFEHNLPKVKPPKTGKKREVPIPDALYRMLSDEPQQGLFVFSIGGSPLRRSDYKDLYKRVFGAINEAMGGSDKLDLLDGMNFYSFRHTYATQVLYYQGVKKGLITTKKAAQIMGHSEKMFIERYTHIDENKEALNQLRELVI